MDLSKPYWVIRCPHCGMYLSYFVIKEGRKKTKKCPYCRKTIVIFDKNNPSWFVVKETFDNPKDAVKYVQQKNKEFITGLSSKLS
jgi:ribosomal protein S27E